MLIIEYFLSGQASVLKLLHLLVNLIVNHIELLGTEPLEGPTGRLICINEVLLILSEYLLLFFWRHVLVVMMQQALKVARLGLSLRVFEAHLSVFVVLEIL